MKQVIKKVGLGAILSLGYALPVLAQGQGLDINPPENTGEFTDVPTAVSTIFNFVILIAAIAFVVLFLVGGVMYLTAAGNEEQTGKAKRLLIDSIVGLVIVLAAFAVGQFILTRLGVTVTF